MTNPAFLTATELSKLLKEKELSPVELTKNIFDRINQLNSSTKAYILPLKDSALEQARKAEDEIANGKYKGPLHGIPLGIKDNYETKDIETTGGSKVFENNIPEENAFSVDQLLDAGGIMIGKLNMHPLGGGLTGTNPAYGDAVNPWNTDYMPGSSSSGSATALGTGLATLTTGSDTFGSIRVPAAMSGIYGMKPTYGLISSTGLMPLAWSLDHAGPMTRSVADTALMLNYMAGYDPKDPLSLNVSVPDYTKDLNKDIKGIKIGIPTHFLKDLDEDIEKLFHQAVATLQDLGAEIKEVDIPELSLTTFAEYTTLISESSAYNYETLQEQAEAEKYAADPRAFFLAGSLINAPQYNKAQQARRKLVKAMKNALKDFDILLGPTIPLTTPPYKEDWMAQNLEVIRRSIPFTGVANSTGLPSFSVPMGLDSDGMPTGMQLIGNHLSEKLLFQIGSAWEKTNPLGNKTYENLDINQ